ncbi:cation:proton antiporter [Pseudoalteromonas sp. BDTF-M6]|uniref:cation:proton antiporter domain-containing protein n=1 Tax=Pseudoalteromonas sp. BDTF-M6 TaxID=2796132 RepID=UPI001BB088AA|nr:cation:proton antiporter [Pseudoalteromonas sp. BDTF-M6]MBS3796663.1 cation:proton antiporter [Pseudoalteromonas sp. BDTF-M6]
MTDILIVACIFLISSIVAVPIATRFGLGSVLGYLIAGIIIAPLLALLNIDLISIQHVAEFGVVMMLFLVGLELEPKKLWSMRAQLIGLGGGQVILTALAIMGAAMFLGYSWQLGLSIGLILTLSSTAIVLQSLAERSELDTEGGKATFSVLLTQDIAVIPILAVLPLLAMTDISGADMAGAHATSQLNILSGLNGWQSALVVLAVVLAVVIGGAYLTGPIFKFVAQARLRELFTATALLLVIGISLMMTLVGLSPALGTFIAGVVLANSPYKHELESNIEPFKGLLLGVFFITVGAGINFGLLAEQFTVIALTTLALIAVKVGVLLVLGRILGIKGAALWLLALGLAQAGEFGFVLLSFSVSNQVMAAAMADQILLVVTLSMLISPLLFILYQYVIAPRYVVEGKSREDQFPEQSHVIIAGSGRVGGLVDRILKIGGFRATVIDHNYHHLEAMARVGVHYFYGDATRPDLLNSAGIDKAKLLVIALDDKEQITTLTHYVLQNYPHVHVLTRAVDRHHVYQLWALGCRDIIRETYDSSLRMGRAAYEALGIKSEQAQQIISKFDAYDKKMMRVTAEAFDASLPFQDNDEYVKLVKDYMQQYAPELKESVASIINTEKQSSTTDKDTYADSRDRH